MRRYQLTFKFCKTESEAVALRDRLNAESTPYIRKNKPAQVTPWTSEDGTEHLFLVWFYW